MEGQSEGFLVIEELFPKKRNQLILITTLLSEKSEACACVLSLETVGDSDIALCILTL